MARGIASKHPYLTIFHFTQRATVLSRHADGVLPLFDKSRLIEHEDASRIAHRVGHELMVVPPHLLLIPAHITDKPLQPADGTPLDLEGHGLNRFPFEPTQLAYHIVEEMGARLAASKTVVKSRLELPQFI